MTNYTYAQRIRAILKLLNIKQKELSQLTGISPANLSDKLSKNSFKLVEYENIVKALGCQWETKIILPDGTEL